MLSTAAANVFSMVIERAELAHDHGLLFPDFRHLRREETGRFQVETERSVHRLLLVWVW